MTRDSTADALLEVYAVVQRMANPGGCAWHEVQTHSSLTRYLVEETYELIDAIDSGAAAQQIETELADVLYQVLFHAAIAEREQEGYSLQSVADALRVKLIARHPHVFGDLGYMSVEELEAEWEHLKEAAVGLKRGSRGALDGVPKSLPTLARATKIIDRLTRAGLLQYDVDSSASHVNDDDIGAELMGVIQKALANGIDPDAALRKQLKKVEE